jgi:hypothetical protein
MFLKTAHYTNQIVQKINYNLYLQILFELLIDKVQAYISMGSTPTCKIIYPQYSIFLIIFVKNRIYDCVRFEAFKENKCTWIFWSDRPQQWRVKNQRLTAPDDRGRAG